MPTIIFCPHCDALILDAPRCPHCGKWERPALAPVGRGSVAWQATLPASLDAALTLAGGALYLCDAEGRLHALDAATGQPVWPRPVALGGWRIHRQVAVAAGRVIVGPSDKATIPAADKAVLALAAATGAELWRRPLDARQVSDPLVAGERVYVATSDGHAVALALADGALCWRKPLGGLCAAAPAAAGEFVIYGSDKGLLAALNAGDGSLAWSFTAAASGTWGERFPYPPVVAGGVLYATCWNGRCYALDVQTGQLRWASEPTQKPPMTPPRVSGDAVYFSARDHYVYALARDTGTVRWRSPYLKRYAQTTPLLIEDRLYVASQDHRVYALDPATGAFVDAPLLETPRHVDADWASDGERIYLGDCEGHIFALNVRVPPVETDGATLEAAGQWAEAAAYHALAGRYHRAAEIYQTQFHEARHAAQLYERGDAPGRAAEMYLAAGELDAARRCFRAARRFDEAAGVSEQLGDEAGAAQDHEDAGRLDRAAPHRERLGQWAQAAGLWERAGAAAREAGQTTEAQAHWLRAAEIYHQRLAQGEKAVQLYALAGRPDLADFVIRHVRDHALQRLLMGVILAPEQIAERYQAEGRYPLAAEEYLKLGRRSDTGRMYELGREYALAAVQYRAAGLPGEAARVLELAGDWPAAAALYREAGNQRKAADLYRQAGDHAEAARLYEAAGWPALAAAEWAQEGQWLRAAPLYAAAGEHRQAAEAWLRLGACDRAAENFWLAAQNAQQAKQPADAVAALYDQAMQGFTDCGDDRRAQACDRLRRWLRGQPLLEASAPAAEEFTVQESGRLTVAVANIGWGMATDITLTIEGQFEADTRRASKPFGLRTDGDKEQTIHIIPLRAGRQLPLHLTISYRDAVGAAMPPLEQTLELTVRDRSGRTGDSTPQQVFVQGHWIQAEQVGEVVGGDKYNAEIKRQTTRPAAMGPARPAAPAAQDEAQMIRCANCGEPQAASRFKCGHCGMPLVRRRYDNESAG